MGAETAELVETRDRRDERGRQIVDGARRAALIYVRDLLRRLPAMTNHDDLAALTRARWKPPS